MDTGDLKKQFLNSLSPGTGDLRQKFRKGTWDLRKKFRKGNWDLRQKFRKSTRGT